MWMLLPHQGDMRGQLDKMKNNTAKHAQENGISYLETLPHASAPLAFPPGPPPSHPRRQVIFCKYEPLIKIWMSYILKLLKGVIYGDYIWKYYRAYQGGC